MNHTPIFPTLCNWLLVHGDYWNWTSCYPRPWVRTGQANNSRCIQEGQLYKFTDNPRFELKSSTRVRIHKYDGMHREGLGRVRFNVCLFDSWWKNNSPRENSGCAPGCWTSSQLHADVALFWPATSLYHGYGHLIRNTKREIYRGIPSMRRAPHTTNLTQENSKDGKIEWGGNCRIMFSRLGFICPQ